MTALLALALLAAAPATAPETLPARFKKTTAFTAWLGPRVVLQEEWIELPESGLRVGYFLAPKADAPKNDETPFEDSFFAVDARTGTAVAKALVRTAPPLNGCRGPGDVSTLDVGESQENAASVHFGAPSQQCLVQLRRTPEGAWSATGFPDPARPADANFPEAARALTNDPKFPKDQVRELTWSYLPESSWLIASSRKECRFWAVNSASAEVGWEASEALTRKICGCAADVMGGENNVGGADMTPVARTVTWTGGGSSLPTCGCDFSKSGAADVECHTWSTGSPAYLQWNVDQQVYESSEGGERLSAIEEGLQAYGNLLAASRVALDAWKAGQEDEALKAWLNLYRQYVAAGRPAKEDSFGELAERIVALRLDEPMDFRHSSIDLWAEILNDLGFALWSHKELKQADAAYEECQRLLSRTGRERNVLNLNRGDLYRDLGQVESAIEAYQRFLAGKVTPGQRKRVEAELRKLQKSAP